MLLSSMELTDMLDTHMLLDTMDTHMLTTDITMERDPLMLSQRLMLMLLSSTELTDMLDTHMLDTTDMPDLMPMDTEPMDTHTGDKSQTHFKDSTKQKLKANNIQL